MDNRSISANDLQAQQNDFTAKFKVDQHSYSKAPIQIKWKLLEEIMKPFESSDSNYALGTKWYVGWDGSSLRIALAPLVLIPTSTSEKYTVFEAQRYELVQEGQQWVFKLIGDWSTRWKGNNNAYIDRYYQVTTVDREDQGFVALDPQKDPCASLISWDWAVLELYIQNKESNDDLDLVDLKIIHGASWSNGGNGGLTGYRHLLCLNICYKGVDRLDQANEDPARPYHNRGANYMQPCPVLCSSYALR